MIPAVPHGLQLPQIAKKFSRGQLFEDVGSNVDWMT